jgi:TolB-like protein
VNAYRSLGDGDGVRSAARRCLERVEAEVALHPDNAGALAFGAIVLTELGDLERAETWAARTAALDPLDSITSYNLACAYVGIGKRETAMERLERVYADPPFRHRSHVEWMKKDSSLAPLHDYPPYVALVARLDAEVAQDAPLHAAGQRPAIAVLPFDNLSGDPDQDYFADGIAEEITAALARARSFFVIARSSTLRYRGQAIEAPQVGRELGVYYLLQGSVRISGDRIRIAAQLVEAATAACIWADRYEGRREDVFDLEDRITERIVGALEPTMRSAEIERVRRKRPDSLEAYDYVMRTLPHMLALTPDASAEALRLAMEAVRLDPGMRAPMPWPAGATPGRWSTAGRHRRRNSVPKACGWRGPRCSSTATIPASSPWSAPPRCWWPATSSRPPPTSPRPWRSIPTRPGPGSAAATCTPIAASPRRRWRTSSAPPA